MPFDGHGLVDGRFYKMRDFLAQPDHWVQGEYGYVSRERTVPTGACLVGAFRLAFNGVAHELDNNPVYVAMLAEAKRRGFAAIERYNDSTVRTHRQIMGFLNAVERRLFISALTTGPAIVRASSLMKVKPVALADLVG